MFKKLTLVGAAFAVGAASLIPAAPATAQSRYDRGYAVDRYGNSYDSRYQGYRQYRGPSGYSSYRARQKCQDGDGGTIIGAIAGGLAGHEIAGRGDHVLGTILGGALGAVAGRAVDRSDRPGYCR